MTLAEPWTMAMYKFRLPRPGVKDLHRCQGGFSKVCSHLLLLSEMASDSGSHLLFVSLSLAVLPLVGVVFSIYLTYSRWLESPFRGLPYPPGPLSKNIISGNSGDIPLSRPWQTYAKWTKIYGKHWQCFNDIISLFVH